MPNAWNWNQQPCEVVSSPSLGAWEETLEAISRSAHLQFHNRMSPRCPVLHFGAPGEDRIQGMLLLSSPEASPVRRLRAVACTTEEKTIRKAFGSWPPHSWGAWTSSSISLSFCFLLCNRHQFSWCANESSTMRFTDPGTPEEACRPARSALSQSPICQPARVTGGYQHQALWGVKVSSI